MPPLKKNRGGIIFAVLRGISKQEFAKTRFLIGEEENKPKPIPENLISKANKNRKTSDAQKLQKDLRLKNIFIYVIIRQRKKRRGKI